MNIKWLFIAGLIFLVLLGLFIATPYKFIPAGNGFVYKVNRFTGEIHVIRGAVEVKVINKRNKK